MPEDLARTLATWAAATRIEALPAEVVTAAKRQVLDTMTVAWAGSDAAGVAAIRDLVVERGGRGESRAWAFGDRLPAPAAARLNGMTAAALDYDALHDGATVHADIVVLPAVAALAEATGAGGKELLTALVVGDEALIRLGLAMRRHPGWFYTSVLGVFAAALASSRLLRLDQKATADALGIALAHAAGSQQALVERSLTKRLQSAFAAEAGVEAALMAARGITGPHEVFEGQCGFFRLYGEGDAAAATDRLGETFHTPGLTFKKYPSCFCNHAAIEATLDIMRSHDVAAEDVEAAEVVLSPFAARLVGAPFAPGDAPQVAAQFSAQYSVASVLLRRCFGLAEIMPDAVLDPKIAALAAKVMVHVDPAREGKFVPADVTVVTRGGRRLSARAETLPGTPERPLTEAELREKALDCFSRGTHPLSASQAEALTTRILELERLDDVRRLYDGLPAFARTR